MVDRLAVDGGAKGKGGGEAEWTEPVRLQCHAMGEHRAGWLKLFAHPTRVFPHVHYQSCSVILQA